MVQDSGFLGVLAANNLGFVLWLWLKSAKLLASSVSAKRLHGMSNISHTQPS
jgi:hypothetical protein